MTKRLPALIFGALVLVAGSASDVAGLALFATAIALHIMRTKTAAQQLAG